MQEDVEDMLTDCMNRESKLTSWESKFIADINEYFEKHNRLTDAMYTKLSEIWERVT